MPVEIITTEDLALFKAELFKELKELLFTKKEEPKKWLKNSDVRKRLPISLGKLQGLRLNGTLPFTKVGSTTFYKAEDVEKLMTNGYQS